MFLAGAYLIDAMICSNCYRDVEPERLKLIPYTQLCAGCARYFNIGKERKGVMISTGKVGSEIQIMSHDCYEKQKKYWTPNGAFSAVKNFSRSTSS
jgi:hypothetical protein